MRLIVNVEMNDLEVMKKLAGNTNSTEEMVEWYIHQSALSDAEMLRALGDVVVEGEA